MNSLSFPNDNYDAIVYDNAQNSIHTGKAFVTTSIAAKLSLSIGQFVYIEVIDIHSNQIKWVFLVSVYLKTNTLLSYTEVYPCCIVDGNDPIINNYECKIRICPEMNHPLYPSLLSLQLKQDEKSPLLNKRLYAKLYRVPLRQNSKCYLNGVYFTIGIVSVPTLCFTINTSTVITVEDNLTLTKDNSKSDQHSVDYYQSVINTLLQQTSFLPGLKVVFTSLINCIMNPILCLLTNTNIPQYKGILISGSPGTGKTTIVKQVIDSVKQYIQIHYDCLTPSDLTSVYLGDGIEQLNNVFKEANSFVSNHPLSMSIIVIENIDHIFMKRTDYNTESAQLVSQLLTLMDGIKGMNNVLVIGLSNQPHLLDPALRRPGRFDKELFIVPPNKQERYNILSYYIKNPLLSLLTTYSLTDLNGYSVEALCQLISEKSRGYVGSDLELLSGVLIQRLSSPLLLTQIQPKDDSMSENTYDNNYQKIINIEDIIDSCMVEIPASLMKDEDSIEANSWNSIGGLNDVKLQLQKVIEWPLKYSKQYAHFKIHPSHGVLLYGPPGCAKTTLARAVASEAHASFWTINGAQVFSPFVGEAEYTIRSLFQKARSALPAVLFIDEIDSLVCKRTTTSTQSDPVQTRVMTTFLTEMDGVEECEGVLVLGATNRPDMIDDALLRPGRFDELIYVPPPDLEARIDILNVSSSHSEIDKDVNFRDIAILCENFSGSDMVSVFREASMIVLRENISSTCIHQKHFLQAVKNCHSSISKDSLVLYEKFMKKK